MIKILYAASNNINSKISLDRFLNYVDDSFTLKVAAFKKSSPSMNIDYTLDCLLNIFEPEHFSLENDNLQIYFEQIKNYKPDLIISDLEFFTSYVGNILNIPVWQCSSSLLTYGLSFKNKYESGIHKKYSYLFNKNQRHNQKIINIVENSDLNLVYSHFGDLESSPELKNNFHWIRPYHYIGKKSLTCKHNIIAANINHNNKILSLLRNNNDCVLFAEFLEGYYDNILIKNIYNQEEYFCNIANSNSYICEGYTNFLADAFYNKKFSAVFNNLESAEQVLNNIFTEKFNLGKIIYNENDLNNLVQEEINYTYNKNIMFLHEKIKKVFNI